MARNFTATSSQWLKSPNGFTLNSLPITISAWFNIPNLPVTPFPIFSIGLLTGGAWIYLGLRNISTGVNRVFTRCFNGAMAVSTSNISTNVWQHAAGAFISNTSRTAYLDGGNKGTDSTSYSYSGGQNTAIGSLIDPSMIYFNGKIAEFGVWNVELTDQEILILSKGYSPLCVRPESLWCYLPLTRDNDDCLISGSQFAPQNSPTIADHTRIIYPGMR